MTLFRALCTLKWTFESDQPYEESLQQVRDQMARSLNYDPKEIPMDVTIELFQKRKRQTLIHIGFFDPKEIFPYVTAEETFKEFLVDGRSYKVRMNSDRYLLFKANQTCQACGLVGTKMALDMNPGSKHVHFNLYAEEDGKRILMTKDHIVAKSCGGKDEMSNYAVCCSICNNLKSNCNITYEQVATLRDLLKNEMRLSKKELKGKIKQIRNNMVQNLKKVSIVQTINNDCSV